MINAILFAAQTLMYVASRALRRLVHATDEMPDVSDESLARTFGADDFNDYLRGEG